MVSGAGVTGGVGVETAKKNGKIRNREILVMACDKVTPHMALVRWTIRVNKNPTPNTNNTSRIDLYPI